MKDTKLCIAETLVATWNGVINRTGYINLQRVICDFTYFTGLRVPFCRNNSTDNHIKCTAYVTLLYLCPTFWEPLLIVHYICPSSLGPTYNITLLRRYHSPRFGRYLYLPLASLAFMPRVGH
jgi:hypothetical protein